MRLTTFRWLLLGAMLGLAGGAALTAMWPVTYTATARVMISTPDWNDSTGTDDEKAATGSTAYGDEFSQQRMSSYLLLLRATRVLTPAARDIGANSSEDIRPKITGRLVPDSVMLDIAATDRAPQRAADLANAVARRFSDAVQELERPAPNASSPVQPVLITGASASADRTSTHLILNLAGGVAIGIATGITVITASRRGRVRIVRTRSGRSVAGFPVLGELSSTDGIDEARARLLLASDRFCLVGLSSDVYPTAEDIASSVAQTGRKVVLISARDGRHGPGLAEFVGGDERILIEGHDARTGVVQIGLGATVGSEAAFIGSADFLAGLTALERRGNVVLVAADRSRGIASVLTLMTVIQAWALVITRDTYDVDISESLSDGALVENPPLGLLLHGPRSANPDADHHVVSTTRL